MQRIINFRYAEAIRFSMSLLPCELRHELQRVDFLTGIDPIYAGLHNNIDTGDKRSYRNTAHCCYSYHSNYPHGKTTVVLPLPIDTSPYVIIHEIGHCVDELLNFEHVALPINEYAKKNREEAFAEAFAAQYFYLGEEAEKRYQLDRETQALFENIRRGIIRPIV